MCDFMDYIGSIILEFASHPLNGWIWFGEGLRGYDNWQRSAASDFKQNGHENMASPLKLVAATTPKSGAEEKLLEIDLIIPTHPDLKISSNPQRREFLIPRLSDPSQEWRMFFLPIGPQKWPNCPVKGLWVWILGNSTPLVRRPTS